MFLPRVFKSHQGQGDQRMPLCVQDWLNWTACNLSVPGELHLSSTPMGAAEKLQLSPGLGASVP